MNNSFTRMARLLLAFGLLFGCSSTKPEIDKARTNLDKQHYEKALKAVNNEINAHPANPEAYYLKGNILFKLALDQQNPSDRSSYYRNMRESLMQSRQLYMDSLTAEQPVGLENINDLLRNGWSNEYQSGLSLLKRDSLSEELSNQIALEHFNNAITLIPDSTQPYQYKARLLYQQNDTRAAINSLTSVLKMNQRPASSVLEQLAYLYLEAGSTDQAIALYEEALKQNTDNTNLAHGLANAYMRRGAHQSAARILDTLTRKQPENSLYRLSYGAQLYHMASARIDSLKMKAESTRNHSGTVSETDSLFKQVNSEALTDQWKEVDTLYQQARRQYITADSLAPKDPEVDYAVARFYKNMALDLRQIQPLFPPDQSPAIEKTVDRYLKSAIGYLEDAVKQRPDHPRYWNQLYKLYNHLGMKQKAEEARSKAKP